ncbi:isoleucine--tRNA ligase, cytoplasmic-like [Episyrphus balteatus]|uniref:isoleucine--tRNA ligase, cytoplasmic-like n=1 Tax=Episyrphus balteatus TaxID=286459 RepID=UPI00248540F6|nr:isoleucine--tRNA ligase, cytoplasmic-like [Episyrphus balteatus]
MAHHMQANSQVVGSKTRREQNDGKFSYHSIPLCPSGHPHSGHILNSLIKDVIKRYNYQKNLRVENSFRWNDHGLSIQYEVDKNLGITLPWDSQKVDIKLYNDQCKVLAEEHTAKWNSIFERLGHCFDSTKQYKTSDTRYMEGVWKVFKKLYDKGLVYEDSKTLPYSTGCHTHLSQFEAYQNIKETSEIGYTITLGMVGSSHKLLIWSSNPLTLNFNSHFSVNPNDSYVKVKVKEQICIVSKNSLDFVFKNSSEYTVLEEVEGKSFEMIPLSNPHILNTREVKYKKPHCVQTGTPLIDKRVDSWFVRVEGLAEELVKNISLVNWFPESSKEDLINWLREHPEDWPVSQNRNWGTPLPIWTSASGDEIVCIGSLVELKTLSGKRAIKDLHRESIDLIRIPSKTPGNPALRRIADVFDGWFESSVLPFIWKRSEQADLVAESIDHIKGWFYTMLLMATALSEPLPFRNVLAHGMTLEPNGSKVNRRKHNHNDPMRLYDKYGADALRLYLLSHSDSNFIVEEEGVAQMTETIIQPLYRIFYKCMSQMGSPDWINYGYITDWTYSERDPVDQWILSLTDSLLKTYIEEMNSYRINTILPKVIELIKTLEEWYIPLRCPEPFRGDKETYSNTLSIDRSTTMLFNVIYRISLVLAPFAPFLTEFIFQIHRKWMVFYRRPESLHGAQILTPDERLMKPDLELNIERMQNIVKIVQLLRGQYMIPFGYQIKEVIVIHHSEGFRQGIVYVKESFKKLLNTRAIEVSDDYRQFEATLKVDLKESAFSKKKQTILNEMNEEKLNELMKGDSEEGIKLENLEISYEITKKINTNYVIHSSGDFLVVIKMNKPLFFYEEGTMKALIHQICNLKKKKNYYPSDCVVIYYSTEDECLKNVIAKHGKHLNQTANCDLKMKDVDETAIKDGRCLEELILVKGSTIKMYLDVKCEENKI